MKHPAEKPGECCEINLLLGNMDHLGGDQDVECIQQSRTKQCYAYDGCADITIDPEVNKTKEHRLESNGDAKRYKNGVKIPSKEEILQFTLSLVLSNFCHLVRAYFAV